jgi:hypothetical protein
MRIKGVWADLNHRLPPDQWVNMWRLEYTGNLSYFVACQVKNIAVYSVPMDELYLEPITEQANARKESRNAAINF